MGFEGDSGGGFGAEKDTPDASDFGGGFGVEGGGAGYGGYGGVGGSGLGGGSPSTGFGGSGSFGNEGYGAQWDTEQDFQDVQAQVQDIVNESNRNALANEREQNRFSMTPLDDPTQTRPAPLARTLSQPAERSWKERARDYVTNRAINYGVQQVAALAPPMAGPLTLGAQLAMAKARGASFAELDQIGGYGMLNLMTGGLLGATVGIGKAAQKGAVALGAKGGPQPGSGEQASSGGFGTETGGDIYAAVEAARTSGELTRPEVTPEELLRRAREYRET